MSFKSPPRSVSAPITGVPNELLRDGEVTDGRLTGCRFEGEKQPVPVEEFRHDWKRKWCEFEARRSLAVADRMVGCVLVTFAVPFVALVLLMFFAVLWVVIFRMPIDINGKVTQPAEATPVVVMLFAIVAGGVVLLAAAIYAWRRIFFKKFVDPRVEAMIEQSAAAPVAGVRLICDFEFSARGERIRAADVLDVRYILESSAAQPVLYMPSNPRIARLVNALPESARRVLET